MVSAVGSEHREVINDPDAACTRDEGNVRVGEADIDGCIELGDSREELPSKDLTGHLAVDEHIPNIPNISHVIFGPTTSILQCQQAVDVVIGATSQSDILEDAKYYQDTAKEYQEAYHSLKDRYSNQAHLMEEVSGALLATEDHAFQAHQELITIKQSHDADIQQAVSKVVSQYQSQLSLTQSCTHNHQVAIKQLQEQIHTLKLSLANCANLLSVGQSLGDVDLWDEVFNILPGMVNTKQGAAAYTLPNQPFHPKNTFNLGTGLTGLI